MLGFESLLQTHIEGGFDKAVIMNPPNIYKYFSIPLQTLAINIKGWDIKRHRYSKEFFLMLSEF